MKQLRWIIPVLLLTGCTTAVQPAEETREPETAEVTADPEAERQRRIDEAMRSETITDLTDQIAKGADGEVYIRRGDAYLAIAQQEDCYDAYVYANQDYVMAYALDGDLSGHKEQLAAIYEARAAHANEEGDSEDYEGYLTRANYLLPSTERYAELTEVRKKLRAEKANTEERTDYHDLDGNVTSYAVTVYDDSGNVKETSTYTVDDVPVDTYDGYEYDDHGNCLRRATFSDELKFTEEVVNTFDETGLNTETKYYALGSDQLLGTSIIRYDDLGRMSGYQYIDENGADAGSVVYRYDGNDEYCGYDSYDAEGNLRYHEDVSDEE